MISFELASTWDPDFVASIKRHYNAVRLGLQTLGAFAREEVSPYCLPENLDDDPDLADVLLVTVVDVVRAGLRIA